MTSISKQRILELLDYNKETGIFTWKKPETNRVKPGGLAGRKHKRGYVVIGLDKKIYTAHRLAWICSNGLTPNGEVDHINGQKTDNRIANLRVVDRIGNMQNRRRANKDGETGFLGVSKNHGSYRAQITANGVRLSLGNFKTPELAHDAYVKAKRIHHKTCSI